jgi:hypothetical protein
MESKKQMTPAEVAEVLEAVTMRFPAAITELGAPTKTEGEKSYFVCDKWDCQPNPGGTIHCECVKGHWVNA